MNSVEISVVGSAAHSNMISDSWITPAKNALVSFDHCWKSSSLPENAVGRPRSFVLMKIVDDLYCCCNLDSCSNPSSELSTPWAQTVSTSANHLCATSIALPTHRYHDEICRLCVTFLKIFFLSGARAVARTARTALCPLRSTLNVSWDEQCDNAEESRSLEPTRVRCQVNTKQTKQGLCRMTKSRLMQCATDR